MIEDLFGKVDKMRANARKRIEAEAKPGETYEQTAARLRQEAEKQPGAAQETQKAAASLRTPPKGDEQGDFFVPALYDVATKDNRSIMDVAVFRLSKKDRRAGEIMRYDLPDGHVQVSAGAAGMASVWDYDLVLMAVSHLTEAWNRHREGRGEKPGRTFRPHVADVLKFCRRSDGGKQKEDLVAALVRLNTTHIAIERQRKGRNGRVYTVSEGEPLISGYQVIANAGGLPESVEIELPKWIYREVTEGKNPDVLTVHPDYFLIDPGIGRFLYRLARRVAGKEQAKWAFQTIYERSGSTGTFKKFTFTLRELIKANDLPEYILAEEAGQGGPLLVMTHRNLIDNHGATS
ncbi:MAG: replication initiator protein A [Zavarzinia sp.]|nr:replication initiator protein A [Zavarzinia sp.]